MKKTLLISILVVISSAVCAFIGGCAGYSDEWLYPESVQTVYVEMFDNQTFRRNTEYTVTDALVKRIESETPYKVISNRNRADSVMSGYLTEITENVLAGERQTGLPLEKQVKLTAVVSWKNLRNGEFILEKKPVTATASYSEFQNQELEYANDVAANKLAELIVEAMQTTW